MMVDVPITEPQPSPFADWCDECYTDECERYWFVPTGRIDEEFNAPIVRMLCEECYRG